MKSKFGADATIRFARIAGCDNQIKTAILKYNSVTRLKRLCQMPSSRKGFPSNRMRRRIAFPVVQTNCPLFKGDVPLDTRKSALIIVSATDEFVARRRTLRALWRDLGFWSRGSRRSPQGRRRTRPENRPNEVK